MSDNLKAGIRFNPDVYAEIGYDSQNETGEMSVIGANGETIWESGEGGGGSSDFSIANVTITSNVGIHWVILPVLLMNPAPDIQGCLSPQPQDIEFEGTQTFQVPLFKGCAMARVSSENGTIFSSVSGSASLMNHSMVIITGDCTLILSENELG